MDLQEIEARLEAATQGPWDFETIPETGESRVFVRSNTGDPMLDVSVAPHGVRAEDAEFIAYAPEDIRALLDEVKAVRYAVARHPDVMECSEYSDDEPVSCGWKHAYEDVVHAMKGGGMNKELVETVAEAQFGEVWRMARNAGHGNSTEAMIIEEAEKAIKVLGEYLLNAVPDDSGADVRKALGL